MVSNNKNTLYAIIPAAGVGSRMKADIPKQYLKLHNKTILEHTVEKLLAHPLVDKVIIAVSDDDPYFSKLPLASRQDVVRVSGGVERADSVLSGLDYLVASQNAEDAWVLVHDAARPCVKKRDIDSLIEAVYASDLGGILATPVRDTMKRGDAGTGITETVDRVNLWHALTPQMFRVGQLRDAIIQAMEAGASLTDEASALEWMGLQPLLVAGSADNIKVTQPEDLALAGFYLGNIEKEE